MSHVQSTSDNARLAAILWVCMQQPVRHSDVLRFGVFEVDLQSEELRKGGLRVKLPGQSFQILRMLLQRPGEPPDGRSIFFTRSSNRDSGIYVIPALGGAERELKKEFGDYNSLSLSADGRYLA